MLLKSLAAGATLALAAGIACAQSLEHWGEVAGWDVLIDPTLGNGCLIQTEYEDGSLVRIGFDHTQDAAYVTVFNEGWGDIEEGAAYDLVFALDGQEYDAEGTGMYLEGVPGVDIVFDSADFLVDIAQRRVMTMFNDSGEVMSIDLGGTNAAIQEAIRCDDAQPR